LDFQAAIDAHIAWKRQLFAVLRSGDWGTQNLDDLALESECVAGRWILEQSLNRAGDPVLTALQTAHREFHRLAATLAHAASSHTPATECMLLEGRLQEHSDRMVEAINLLRLRGRHMDSSSLSE